MRLRRSLLLFVMFISSSIFLTYLILGAQSSIILGSNPTATTSFRTKADSTTSTTTALPPTVTTTTTPSTTTTEPTSTDSTLAESTVSDTIIAYPASSLTSDATVTSSTTLPTVTTTTVPETTTTTGTQDPVIATDATITAVAPTTDDTTDTLADLTDTTADASSTTDATSTDTATTSAVPAASTSAGATTQSTTSAQETRASETATSLTAPADDDALTDAMLDITSQIAQPVTENAKYCPPVNRKLDGMTFLLEGPASRILTVFNPSDTSYCANLTLDDLPDGDYKLKISATYKGRSLTRTFNLTIDKTKSQNATDQKTSELENKCSQLTASSSEECTRYYLEKYANRIACSNLDGTGCTAAATKNIDSLVEAQRQYEAINSQSGDLIDKSMTVGKLENIVNDTGAGDLDLSVPIKTKETEIRIIRSSQNVIVDKDKGLIRTAPIAVMIDNDGDGLSDDFELRIGTRIDKTDTDGDGYKDGEEVSHGYNPLGDGKKDLGLAPIDKALLLGQTIDHPKTSGQEDESFKVVEVKTVYDDDGKEDGYSLNGKAEANSVVTLYIYSDIPIVVTVKTDEYGNWQYELDDQLEAGDHEVYVAINDETGKVMKKSSPMGFIAEAKAVSSDKALPTASDDAADNITSYYLYAAGGLMIIGIIVFLAYIIKSRKKKKIKSNNDQTQGTAN